MNHAELARQRAHYAEVRRRLMSPVVKLGPPPPPPEPEPAPVEAAVIEASPDVIAEAVATIAAMPAFAPRRDRAAIIREVADRHGVPVDILLSPSRRLPAVRARQEAYYRLMADMGYGWSELGRIFSRDHTSVIHGVRSYCAEHGLQVPKLIQGSARGVVTECAIAAE